MTQSSPFRIDALERDGLHAVALTFDDPMKAIERLQQSDGMSAYWGFLIDMDHEIDLLRCRQR